MLQTIHFIDLLSWSSCLCRRLIHRRRFSRCGILNLFPIIFLIILLSFCFAAFFLPPINDDSKTPSDTPFNHLIPSDPFDLFWTMWNTHASTFRGRHLLVLESLFIHHPHATVIMLSPTLNDTQLFLPFRSRGYRIYAFNISPQYMIQWKWYLNHQTRDFLRHWNSSNTYFSTDFTLYLRTIVLYLYGGTYLDMDALILQPLPHEEFIGLDRTADGKPCDWCIKNTSGCYVAPTFMRFRPRRRILRRILQQTFTRQLHDASCLHSVGPKAYTLHITRYRQNNDFELTSLRLLEPHRLYPYMSTETSLIFHHVEQDTPLELADLMKRSYSLYLYGSISNKHNIAQGSLLDLLFYRFDLGDLRPKILNRHQLNMSASLIHSPLYIYTRQKQGRFLGRDVIYLRLDHTFSGHHVQWNITIHTYNGTIVLPSHTSLSNLNQAQINLILNQMSYTPSSSTSTDTLLIDVRNEDVSVSCSLTIIIFSQWVTILTKTMGTIDRWPVLQRLAASVERYYPDTTIRVASDSGQPIDAAVLLNFITTDNISGYNPSQKMLIHNLPDDSGLSICRNYLLKVTTTPFFFLLDDDFELEEDSHLDILLEIIYTYEYIDIIAGKVPEDMKIYHDYAGIYLLYNQTLELMHYVPNSRKSQILYPRSSNNNLNTTNPCRQVDFVPNVFMGRTETFRSVSWDDELKLGEHEDFFIRFGQANRTVYTCHFINVHHIQVQWWLEINHPYYQKRGRVTNYYKQMMRKHNLKRLISFGYTNLDFPEVP